jgi:hypothetical protein
MPLPQPPRLPRPNPRRHQPTPTPTGPSLMLPLQKRDLQKLPLLLLRPMPILPAQHLLLLM